MSKSTSSTRSEITLSKAVITGTKKTFSDQRSGDDKAKQSMAKSAGAWAKQGVKSAFLLSPKRKDNTLAVPALYEAMRECVMCYFTPEERAIMALDKSQVPEAEHAKREADGKKVGALMGNFRSAVDTANGVKKDTSKGSGDSKLPKHMRYAKSIAEMQEWYADIDSDTISCDPAKIAILLKQVFELVKTTKLDDAPAKRKAKAVVK